MTDDCYAKVCHGTITRYNIGYKQFGHKSPFQFFDLDRYQWDRTRFSLHCFPSCAHILALQVPIPATPPPAVDQVRGCGPGLNSYIQIFNYVFIVLYCAVQAVNRHGSGPLSDIMVGPELHC